MCVSQCDFEDRCISVSQQKQNWKIQVNKHKKLTAKIAGSFLKSAESDMGVVEQYVPR